MDLLLISRCPPFPLHLGDRLIPYYLAQQLSSRNHFIDLIAFYDQPEDLANVPRYARYFRHIQLIREPRRATLDYANRALNPARLFPTTAEESWSPEMWDAIRSRISSDRYDVVELFGGIQVSEYYHLIRNFPNVIVPYESYTLYLKSALAQETSRLRYALQRVQLLAARRFESRMFSHYDRVVLLSDSDAKMLKSLARDLPVYVIPNGVDAEYLIPTGYEPDEPNLMFIGNYQYEPNLDAATWLAQKIFPRVKQRVPKARLLLVGANPPPALLALADEDIDVTGRVPDVRPYWEQALIFVSPLRFGAGIKNKLLEAMAMQKPIVATPLSISGIALESGKHVLLGSTAEELYRAIMQLIKDAEVRRTMGQANRALVEAQYTWRRVADQYEELYRQIIEARGHWKRF
ncbi:MAG TPA: glycosyltransferase [Aggregatilineales bacterium]|nr:glycosyltransferase [Aggregatilineales bacterium]